MTNPAQPIPPGHRARLRYKFSQNGADSFLDHELLELLLTYALPRKDTKPLAWALLKKFGSLKAVLDAPAEKLTEVDGIGPAAAQLIVLVRALFTKYARAQMSAPVSASCPREVIEYCKTSLQGKREEFLEIIFLSVRNTILGTQIIASGLIDRVAVSPRKIVECALRAKAAALILVHNHPSGDARPSEADIEMTEQIKKAAELFNIELHDHIIVAGSHYFSLHEAGKI